MPTWNPEDYARSSSEQQRWARELIAKLALRGQERILDIGCGDGKVTAEIARQLPRGWVVGVDVSPQMIGFAANAFPQSHYPNLTFALKDASRLDFDAEFDIAFSNAALHWVKDHRPVLQGIHRALKVGGRTMLQMGGAGNAAEAIRIMEEIMAESPWRPFFLGFEFPYGFYGPDEYSGWLSQAGLRPIRVELIPKDMVHPGAAGLAAWIRTAWLPYTQRVTEERREQFIAEVVQRYLQQYPPDAQGNVHVRMSRLEVEAAR